MSYWISSVLVSIDSLRKGTVYVRKVPRWRKWVVIYWSCDQDNMAVDKYSYWRDAIATAIRIAEGRRPRVEGTRYYPRDTGAKQILTVVDSVAASAANDTEWIDGPGIIQDH